MRQKGDLCNNNNNNDKNNFKQYSFISILCLMMLMIIHLLLSSRYNALLVLVVVLNPVCSTNAWVLYSMYPTISLRFHYHDTIAAVNTAILSNSASVVRSSSGRRNRYHSLTNTIIITQCSTKRDDYNDEFLDKDDCNKLSRSPEFHIRDCTFEELNTCADIILKSFYNTTTVKSPWRQLYRMGELNRIQQGFPYGDDRSKHRMIVATIKNDNNKNNNKRGRIFSKNNENNNKEKIVAFVDIDIRKPNRQTAYTYNPRPYLSDLCVDPDYRRMGIAKSLILHCEQFCLNQEDNFYKRYNINNKELYIRVEAKNINAVQMYYQLGYKSIEYNPDCSDGSILILHKKLVNKEQQQEEDIKTTNSTTAWLG